MADPEKWELLALQQEFDWILQHQIPESLKRLTAVVEECARHFPMSVGGLPTPLKLDKFVMATASHNAQDSIKCVVTLLGDNITNADIVIKLQKTPSQYHGTLQSEWKLQQVQDSANHLQSVLMLVASSTEEPIKSPDEGLFLLNSIISALQKGRNALVIPKKRTIDDLASSRNIKSLIPVLPNDLAVSFFIQANKLIFAVYLMSQAQGAVKFDSYQAECPVPWLSEVLLHYSDALQLCQQLKDKVLSAKKSAPVLLDCLFSNCEKKLPLDARLKHLTEDHQLFAYETPLFRLNLAEDDVLPSIESGASKKFVSNLMSCYRNDFAVVVEIQNGILSMWCELASPLKEMENIFMVQFELESDRCMFQWKTLVYDHDAATTTCTSLTNAPMTLNKKDVREFIVEGPGKPKRRMQVDIVITYKKCP